MKVVPRSNFVLLKPVKPSEKSAGGLFLPGSNQSMPTGEVIAVGEPPSGENLQFIYPELQPGHTVMFTPGSGMEVMHEGQPCQLVAEAAILAILQPDDPASA